MELGTQHWIIPNPGFFPVESLSHLDNNAEQSNIYRKLSPSNQSYHVNQYHIDLTRHTLYGKNKRTEFAMGLSLNMSFKDRHILTTRDEKIRENTISEDPYEHIRTTNTVWVNLYDRYSALGIGPKAVGRLHINQRLSANTAIVADFGYPFGNEYLAVIGYERQTEWVKEEDSSVHKEKWFDTKTLDKPLQWHFGLAGRSGLSYKLFESYKVFLELGVSYGVRKFFAHNKGNVEWYYAPSIGFRAYL